MEPRYQPGIVLDLMNSEFMTSITTRVLHERIEKSSTSEFSFFSPAEFEILSLVCDRLMAQDSNNRVVNSAIFIDERLSNNRCDGWRYNNMPPDKQMFLKGIQGIEELSRQLFNKPFTSLNENCQLEILHSLQNATAKGEVWIKMSSQLFFEELLCEATEIFYSFPLVQEEIGYVGMADAKGWPKIGLNEKNEIEPEPIFIKSL